MQAMIRRWMHHAGIRVLSAGSGTEALGIVERFGHEIDTVAIDLLMPGMAGEELIAPRIDASGSSLLATSGMNPDDAASNSR